MLVSGTQQERLIEGLLTLARGEAGLDRRELVDLSVVADSVLLTPAADRDRLDLHVETAIMPATLMGDPRLVERLVINLVDNAMRHNVAAGTVHVSTGMVGLRATLRVANDGPVIPAGEMDRLFQCFQRMTRDRTGAHGEGVGLGLSIVQAIANAHGARVHATPQPEGGLLVEVSFPPVVGPMMISDRR
ncbi:MAG: sensor histidine kinase [Acidimicrobiales bacterium]